MTDTQNNPENDQISEEQKAIDAEEVRKAEEAKEKKIANLAKAREAKAAKKAEKEAEAAKKAQEEAETVEEEIEPANEIVGNDLQITAVERVGGTVIKYHVKGSIDILPTPENKESFLSRQVGSRIDLKEIV